MKIKNRMKLFKPLKHLCSLFLLSSSIVLGFSFNNKTNTNQVVNNNQQAKNKHKVTNVADPVGGLMWTKTQVANLHIFADNSVLNSIPDSTRFSVFLNAQGGADFHGIYNWNGSSIVEPTTANIIQNPTLNATWLYNGIQYSFGDISDAALRCFAGTVTFNKGFLIRMRTVVRPWFSQIRKMVFNLGGLYAQGVQILNASDEKQIWSSVSLELKKENHLFDNLEEIDIDSSHINTKTIKNWHEFDFTVANGVFYNKLKLRLIKFTRGNNIPDMKMACYLFKNSFAARDFWTRRNGLQFLGYDGSSLNTGNTIRFDHIGYDALLKSGLKGTLDLSKSPGNLFEPNASWPEEEQELALGYTYIDNLILPNNITTIPYRTFLELPSLRQLTIPSSLTRFSNGAFLLNTLDVITFNYTKQQILQNFSFGQDSFRTSGQKDTLVRFNFSPFTDRLPDLISAMKSRITGTTDNWHWIFDTSDPYTFTFPSSHEDVYLKGDEEASLQASVSYTMNNQLKSFLVQHPNLQFYITEDSWPSAQLPNYITNNVQIQDNQIVITYRCNGNNIDRQKDITFNPVIGLKENESTRSATTWNFPETTIHIQKSDTHVTPSVIRYTSPSNPPEANTLWLPGDEASFSLHIPNALIGNNGDERNFIANFPDYVDWYFLSGSTRSTIYSGWSNTDPNKMYIDGYNAYSGYLEVHKDENQSDNFYTVFNFVVHQGGNSFRDWPDGTMNFKVKHSDESGSNISINAHSTGYFDPNYYTINTTTRTITLSPTQKTTDITFNIPVRSDPFNYNSYKWWANKGAQIQITAPNLNGLDGLISVTNWRLNDDYTTLSATITLLKQVQNDQTINLNGGRIYSSSDPTKGGEIPSIDIIVPSASRNFNVSDTAWISQAPRYGGTNGLWVKNDQASFDVTLNRYWIGNPSTLSTSGFNDYFNLYDGSELVTLTYNEQEQVFYGPDNLYKVALIIPSDQPTDYVNNVKLKITITALKGGFSGNLLTVKTKVNNLNIKEIQTINPFALDPRVTSVYTPSTISLSYNSTQKTVTWRIYKTAFAGIVGNTYQYYHHLGTDPKIVFPDQTTSLIQNGVELTNVHFNSDFDEISGTLTLLKDKVTYQRFDFNANNIKLTTNTGEELYTLRPFIVAISGDQQPIVNSDVTYNYSSSQLPTRTINGLWLPNDQADFSFTATDSFLDNTPETELYTNFNRYLSADYNDQPITWTYNNDTASYLGTVGDTQTTIPYSFSLSISSYLPNKFNTRTYTIHLKKTKISTKHENLRFAISSSGSAVSLWTNLNGLGINEIDPGITSATPNTNQINLSETEISANFTYRLDILNVEGYQINTFSYLRTLPHRLVVFGEDNDFYHFSNLKMNDQSTEISGTITINKVAATDQSLPLTIQVLDMTAQKAVVATLPAITLNIAKGNTNIQIDHVDYSNQDAKELKRINQYVTFIIDTPNILVENDLIHHLDIHYTEGSDLSRWTWTKKDASADNVYISSNGQYELTYKLRLASELYNRESYWIKIKQIVDQQVNNHISVGLINQDPSSDHLSIKTTEYNPPIPPTPPGPTPTPTPENNIILIASLSGAFGFIGLILLIILIVFVRKKIKEKRFVGKHN